LEPYVSIPRLPEIAYYYPEPVWEIGDHESNWIKNLILFFDGIGLLIPPQVHDKLFSRDPSLVYGLSDYKLLHLFDPKDLVNTSATQALADAISPLVESGAFDHLRNNDGFDHLSYSRLGYYASEEIFQQLYGQFLERGLAGESVDGGFSFPVSATLRSLILVLWAQLLRAPGKQLGFDFHPVTNNPRVQRGLRSFLSLPMSPSSGHVVSLDLQTVGVNLTTVAIDDVLAFKEDHGKQYRAYRRNVHDLLRQIRQSQDEEESRQILEDRIEQLKDMATEINSAASETMKKGIKDFAIGLVGTYVPIEPLKGIAQAVVDPVGPMLDQASSIFSDGQAFSYLFRAQLQFGSDKITK
jgi:hypothetical protein